MTDDPLGFEPLDDELRRQFRAAAPGAGDADATLRTLAPRFARARRRRQLIVAGGSLLSAVLVVFVGAIALGAGGGGDRSVQVPPASRSTHRQPATTTTTSPSPDGTATSATSGTAAGDGPAATPGNTGTAIPSAPAGADASDDAVVPAPSLRTFDSAGGSVTVELANGTLAIVLTAPVPGYSEERHDTGPSRVEVRFKNEDGEWRVRVDLVDGEMVDEITHH